MGTLFLRIDVLIRRASYSDQKAENCYSGKLMQFFPFFLERYSPASAMAII